MSSEASEFATTAELSFKVKKTGLERLSNGALISPEHQRLITKLETITDLNMAQKGLFASLPLRIRTVPARAEIIGQGQRTFECCLILDGAACRSKMLADGDRQILSLHLPGDVPDLQSLYLDKVDYDLCTLTTSRLAFIAHEALRDIMAHDAGVAVVLMKYISVDGSIFREWIANLGQRPALGRVAHLFCEFFVCRRALGLAPDNALSLPLTQNELADVTGLSAVHVNRVIRQLRRFGYISSHRNSYRITDWAGLMRVAGFSPRYLHLKSSLSELAA